MRVSDVVRAKRRRLINIFPDESIRDASRLIVEHAVGALLVCEADGGLIGLLPERDIIRFITLHGDAALDAPVREAMQHAYPVASPNDPVVDVMRIMIDQHIRHLPVIDAGIVVDVISIGDVLKSRLVEKDEEAAVLRDIARATLAIAA